MVIINIQNTRSDTEERSWRHHSLTLRNLQIWPRKLICFSPSEFPFQNQYSMYISLGWKIKQNHKWLHLLLDTALWNLKLRYPMKRGLLLLTFRVQLECQSTDLKPSGAHMVPPILETAYALQFHSLDPVIAKAKPKSDDVISPNNSPFSESVITVYTFPCQSAGLPPSLLFFSRWQLVLWTFGWNKHSFLGHERLSPWSGASAHSPEFRMSWWGFSDQEWWCFGDGEALRGTGWCWTLHPPFPLPHQGVPSPW